MLEMTGLEKKGKQDVVIQSSKSSPIKVLHDIVSHQILEKENHQAGCNIQPDLFGLTLDLGFKTVVLAHY